MTRLKAITVRESLENGFAVQVFVLFRGSEFISAMVERPKRAKGYTIKMGFIHLTT